MTEPVTQSRRAQPRASMRMPVRLIVGKRIHRGEIVDMSIGGIKVRTDAPVNVRQAVDLAVPVLGQLRAVVVADRGPVSLTFVEDEDGPSKADIADFIQTILVAGSASPMQEPDHAALLM